LIFIKKYDIIYIQDKDKAHTANFHFSNRHKIGNA
jgi:hypothetical protein